ncbi:TonB family protein [Hymenobacter gummosus]|uniref:TonB family protein n=1 Tax=Hymenobacter gummosus TaxID=1776032 RepID=A0A3S0IL24_9BACT|nr:energy transducer TonB [Hymenobacter gummosus]RTQ47150.1 TonB family protein [Hymenobacter gummosus]
MLHELPITNVRLSACPEAWEQMTPTARGRHCRSCQREVIDFTQGTAAQLSAAQAAASDGRVCGRFRVEQVAAGASLRLRQRWFLAAAVLVLLQGLSACEVREQLPAAPATTKSDALALTALADSNNVATQSCSEERVFVGMISEPMPEFPGGQEAMLEFLRATVRYPATEAEGKVFVTFTIDGTGAIHDAKVLKGVHPLLDAEALRAVRLMPRWQINFHVQPPRPSYGVGYTLPISFRRG